MIKNILANMRDVWKHQRGCPGARKHQLNRLRAKQTFSKRSPVFDIFSNKPTPLIERGSEAPSREVTRGTQMARVLACS